jgi:diguanylate cyclase (GGDEF)-like protein
MCENASSLRDQANMRAHKMTKAELLEANDRLTVAMVHLETMATAAKQTATQMSHMAVHDFLTGLPNRVLLTDRLSQSISLAHRNNKRIALLYMDLDHFKNINDSLGHSVGDQLLQSVATRIQECIRVSDTISRQGGDEFVVLMPDVVRIEDVTSFAEKLIETVSHPHSIGSHQIHIGLSIGISLYPDDAQDIESLIRNADIAMYHCKAGGRNSYQMFTEDMNIRAVARQAIEASLRHAIVHNEFELHYQPKVNLKTGAITGAEALLRWNRPDQPPIYPEQFIPIAEDSGLILPIGKWVLREACMQSKIWQQAGLGLRHIAVNVSAQEFHSKKYFHDVCEILEETGLPPHNLELELTESALFHDTKPMMTVLNAIKGKGIQIAIDDFGTGYSSLSYLRRFPIDALKIDKSFVKDISGDGGDAIVSAVIAMGRSLNHRVIAEGIETREQLDFLQSHRCEEGQGYYFGRPVPAREFAKLLTVAP